MFPKQPAVAGVRMAFFFAGVALLGATQGVARTWRVAPDGSGDAPTIQAGIDSALAGDIVLLAPGTYTWTAQPGTLGSMVRLAPGLTLRGETGAAATLLDAESQGRVLECLQAGEVLIEDLTFQNGRAPRSPQDSHGGAILLGAESMPTIRRCVFRSNVVSGGTARGGAVYCGPGIIEDCEFAANRAGLDENTNGVGGAVACAGATIRRCVFRGNRTRGFTASAGGAVYSVSATITECLFEDNHVASAGTTLGGAIRDGGTATISHCTFRDNAAEGHYFFATGGAVNCSIGLVTDCLFIRNAAVNESGAGRGGAIAGTQPTIRRCTFIGNSALRPVPLGPGFGGAIFLLFEGTIENCTLVGNSGGTPDGIGGIELQEGGTLHGVLLTQTPTGSAWRGDARWTCSILFGNVAGDDFPPDTGGSGNFVADPLYCNDPMTSEEVSIRADSPCLAACGTIGAGEVGCKAQAVRSTTWSALKQLYRPGGVAPSAPKP